MLILSSIMPVSETLDSDILRDMFLKWVNEKNKHFKPNEINANIFSIIDENTCIEGIEQKDSRISAFRHKDETVGGIWETSFVLDEKARLLYMYMERSVGADTTFKKPYYYMPTLIRSLVENGYSGSSGGFSITNKAIKADDSNKSMVLGLVNGSSFPVIYLASGSPLDSESLAAKLVGTAIVIVDNSDFLKKTYTNIFNEHNIYLISGKNISSFEDNVFHREIQARINEFHNSALREPKNTWNGLSAEIAHRSHKCAMEKYKAAKVWSEELSDFYDAEHNEYQNKITSLQNENAILSSQLELAIQQIERMKNSGASLLKSGNIEECYENETAEILIDELKADLANAAKPSRRHDVLKSVLDANLGSNTPKARAEKVKKILKGYKTFTPSMVSALNELGITVEKRSGGHTALIYHDNPKYVCTAASTCSDSGRGGDNLASEVIKIMF